MTKENRLNKIGVKEFERKVLKEGKPVLLLCMFRDGDYQKQTEILKEVLEGKKEEMKVDICVLEEDFLRVFMDKYNVKGTPTFLAFDGGSEKGRLLGKADRKRLGDFLRETLF